MSTYRTRIIVCLSTLAVAAVFARPAVAEQISSALYINVDTSGSMMYSTGGTECHGDNSTEHPGDPGCDSRLYVAKNAIDSVVNGYPEVRWGLSRFEQITSWNQVCRCDDEPESSGGNCGGTPGLQNEIDINGNPVCVTTCTNTSLSHDRFGIGDRVCINYQGTCNGADILVALADDNEDRILKWVNHQEPVGQFFTATDLATGDFCWTGTDVGDCELRANGGTPLGASLADLYDQLSTTDIGNDTYRGCRPYSVIMLTDGSETCGGNAVTGATNLRSTPDMLAGHTCSVTGDCPPNSWCSGGRCRYDVKTYVIAFALTGTGLTAANNIAAAGGTGAAIGAWDENELTSAMAGIIAESIVQEFCNDADDDCDGLVDEDFPLGQTCNNGMPGLCFGTGTYICDPADPSNVICDIQPAPPNPGDLTESCNGLDDDCDGEIDEGGVCTCNGPELCNGYDDYCDGYLTAVEGSEDPNIGSPCGTDVGACTTGLTICLAGGVIGCSGVGQSTELCDANVEDNDQNCNGVNNDGIIPQPCSKTHANGIWICTGLQTCNVDGTWDCWAQDPAAETCNNFDDNCDGSIDEGLSQACQVTNAEGTCTGVETCTLGVWGGCTATPALAEACNNADDNCNGAVDEGLNQACQVTVAGVGTCDGVETCSAGSWVGCTAATPAVEICNNIDDNCDGSTDEGLSQACYTGPAATLNIGICVGGTQTCAAGSWGGCLGETTPTTETCNLLDDDCDGVPDDGLGQTTCGLGECVTTVDNCIGGVQQTCTPPPGQPETCDGLDNDCDGIVDGLTEACYEFATGCTLALGVWTCQGTCSTGTHTCPTTGGGWGACQFDVGPGTEVCDGQDNDCDGLTDENLTESCYPLGYGLNTGCTGPGACVGVCSEGNRICSGGAWGTCGGATTPSPEACNNADDDCDGDVDEGLNQACQVNNTFGTCTGVESCNLGVWQACNAPTPAAETCNNNDDDCDGAVDEGVTQPCYTGVPASTLNVGACVGGTQTCTAGVFGSCNGEVTPTPEVCDGIDNDCDGQTDEDAAGNPLSQPCYSGAAGTENHGVCTGGTRTCTGGAWSTCVGEVVPSAEQCNNLDDDCDDLVDENLGTTTCGLGLCQHTVDNCVNGAAQTCDPYLGANPEECDGIDNDCDGVVDGLARNCYEFASGCTETTPGVFACDGTCASGLQVCPVGGAGNWGECLYDVGPEAEVCDSLDNDCDGDVDEAADGSPLSQDCYPPGSGASTGCTFDVPTQTWDCLGLCTAGVRECLTGVWGTCTGHVTPTVEVCDGSDNDCDGDIDEPQDIPGLNQPCGTALGRCTPGVLQCINAQEVCQGGDGPFLGVCNGEDDDCDGEIDEPDEVAAEEGLPCGESQGACEPGLTQCVGGQIQCVGGVLPIEEVCDGLDNDCDGDIDDQAECPPDYWCVQADCRHHCDPTSEFPCPGTQDCTEVDVGGGQMEYVCLPDSGGECGGVTCPAGWICVDDICVDPCDPNPCQVWEDCHVGACIDNSCTGLGQSCNAGEFCINHECVPDPCLSATCDIESEICVRDCDELSCDYSCSALCSCPPGQTCEADGTCVEDACAAATCGLGERCDPDTGTCETDPCAAIFCSSWETCFEGACMDDPCSNVDCPEFYNCEIFDVGDATPTPEPRCVADTAFYTPGADGDKFLATGAGGCQCRSTGAGDLPGGILLLLAVLGLLGFRRRAAGRGGVRSKTSTIQTIALLCGLTLVGATGCKLDPYDTGGEGGWNFPDASTDDALVPDVEVPQDACVPVEEVCDEVDNDCDGVIDNGYDLATDEHNCGACGTVCEFDYAFAGCADATCIMGDCLPGHWDNDGDSNNGCEYACHTTNDGTEVCDGVDNDCDGTVDEDFDLLNDSNNCGQCHLACSFFQGVGACVNGACELSDCRGGFVDKDGNANNGCECMMDLTEGTVACVEGAGTCGGGEVCADVSGDGSAFCATIPIDGCDAVDNDCDGQLDEDAPSQMAAGDCYTHPVGCTETTPGVYNCIGLCAAGQPTCVGGEVQCGNQTGPAAELCDDLDNDCNGTVDDGYDKLNDPANCGGCGIQCSAIVTNGIPGCVNGTCVALACLPGYYDYDANPADCEYVCTLTNGGVEDCADAIDNDCDGLVNEGFDYTSDAANCGSCGNDCSSNTPFGTTVTGCIASTCEYACQTGYVDTDSNPNNGCEYSCTQTNGGVEICDGVDNDCDVTVDEGFNIQTDVNNCGSCGNQCTSHVGTNSVVAGCANGVCQFACAPGSVDLDGDVAVGDAGTGCEYTCPVNPPVAEVCDGVDNDCDGDTDEDATGSPMTESCYSGAAGTDGVGPCHAGTRTCTAGGWSACAGELIPSVEVCDGVDNDCDNTTDEAGGGGPLSQACYTGPSMTQNVGLCVGGTQTCTGGAWGVCNGEVTPAADVCDLADNDCDGSADEDYNTQTDVLNCGSCNYQCTAHVGAYSYATGCVSGGCTYACQSGHYDNNSNVNLGDAGDGCEYPCTLTNGGVEACGDTIDNDCDGAVDEGFDLVTDENNCGSCGYACSAHIPYGATGNSCVGSSCVYTCLPDFYNLDSDMSNGCEYNCLVSPPVAEICDDADNDCDGLIDEDFNKDSNPSNCGACGYVCASHVGSNSVATGCSNGNCQYSCVGGFADLNGDVSLGDGGNGCEYTCPVYPTVAELCDDVDNDCDGVKDEDAGGAPLSRSCYTGVPASTENVGLCHGGTQTCAAGIWGGCAGEVIPVTELCDSLDNDCDTLTDEDFDVTTDLNNCGGCNQSCWASAPANAYPSACLAGVCQFTCFTGYADNNSNMAGDGCEYTCPVNPPVAEYCDGWDNDCDGAVDEGLTAPVGFCYQGQVGSPCFGVGALCEDPDGAGGPLLHSWYCQYPASVEVTTANPNQLLGYEILCDGLDGDCDGVADDNFNLGAVCDNGGYGACRVTGTLICDTVDATGTECNLPLPSTWPVPTDEVCDGADNDCDGLTDENSWDNNTANDTLGVQGWVIEDLVTVTTNGYVTEMYRFEASRPTATAADAGAGNDWRSCSLDGTLPWGFVTYTQARRACARAGLRLCNGDQWYDACSNAGANAYPYSGAYNSDWCNGSESPGVDQLDPTGAHVNCDTAVGGIMDMSGNLREWTDDFVGTTSSGDPIYRLRGGGYFDLEGGLACDFDSSAYVASVQGEHVGFRCCSTCGNGTVEPWETCDPAPPASDSDCHPQFCGPDTCGDGNLDVANGEICDDGNLIPLDGCNEICQIDVVCGDGVREGSEECDDGNLVSGDGCSNICVHEIICGDGVTEGTEECDDGNTTPLDGCSATCTIENWVSVLSENFNTCLPAGWTIEDGGQSSDTWECCPVCADNDSNSTGSPSGGNYMKADSDQADSGDELVEGLVTPAVNLSTCTNVRLSFYQYYDDYNSSDRAQVQYSTNGQAGPWTTLVTYTTDQTGLEVLDVSATAGQANVSFRFYYDDGDTWAWYWKLDDVSVDCMN